MKKLNQKLFITAVIACVLELVAIVYVGMNEIVLPTWGIIGMGVLAVVALLSLVLFLIRKCNGADQWDNL